METFQFQLTRKLSRAITTAGFEIAAEVTPASDPRFGDYQTNAALMLAKQRGENPRQIAETIISKLDVAEIAEPPSVAGAGFINFTLSRAAVEKQIADMLTDDRLGVEFQSPPKRIIVDFGSPNVAKPMHVGHIRSTFLGDALARIAQFLGHDVIRDNHLGDWGTQFGLVIYGWKHGLNREALARDPIAELVRIYKETNERATADETVREAARTELVKLQSGDPENFAIWKQCVDLSMQEFNRAYELLGIHYDIVRGESFYNDRLAEVVDRLLKSGIAELSEGAVCVFVRDIPDLADKPCIIRKRDGGFNYATTDVATVDYRINDLKRDTIWIVTGAPQQLHFRQIFEIARREGYRADFRHITHGSILGGNRKLMKTRSGENIPLDDLLEEAISRAGKIVAEKNPELGETERGEIAKIIGIGAIKYADLAQYRMTDYVFSWDKMLSLHGNTAPYLQNAYVRIRSIFRRVDESISLAKEIQLEDAAELQLAKKLCQFAEVVPQVLNDFRPNILTNYLFELANNFHSFYEACPVLRAKERARDSRLALCHLCARVLQRGLDLLGIKVPERM
jgi:arginyl-tRNA synthetase